MKQPIRLCLLSLFIASSLSACGSSDSDDQVSDQPTANDDAVSFSGNDSQLIDVLANDTDPNGDTLVLISVSVAEYGVTAIQENQVEYTPATDFVGVDTFSYVMSDGEYEAEAEVTVTMSQSVSLVGRIIDAPIANATVVIELQDQRFTVEADEEGNYELPIEITSLDSNEVLRMRARGSELHSQAFVTLSSRLLTVGQLLELAGAGGELTRSELNQVQVTQITTARDFLLTRAAGDQVITSENIQGLDNSVNPELIMEMAAVIKLLVDDENYVLPDGVETLEDFLEDATSYNETLEQARQSGDLDRAIEETLSDPEVMPELNTLLGRYVQIIDTPYFMTNRSFRNYEFRDDGTMIFGGGVKEIEGVRGRFLNRTYNWHQDGNENRFESVDGEANFEVHVQYVPYDLMDDEQRAEFVAEYGDEAKDWVWTTTRYDFVDSFRVLSLSENDAVVRLRNRMVYPLLSRINAQDDSVVTIPELIQYSEQTIRLANVDDLKLADGRFENVTDRPITLPDLYGYIQRNMYQLNPDGTAELVINDHYYHFASNYYIGSGEWKAYWSLHEDDSMLRITLRDQNGDVVNYLDTYKHREGGAAMGLLGIYHNALGESFITLSEAGQVPEVELTAEQLIAQLDDSNMLVSAVNRSLPDWEGYQIKASDWFGWSLHNDGSGQLPEFLCDGSFLFSYEVCEGEHTYDDWPLENLAWQIQDQAILIDREVDYVDYFCNAEYSPAYENGAPCNRRVIIPLRQTEQGIVLGIEYNISNTHRFIGGEVESKPFYLVEPRFMVWTIQDLPDVHQWARGMQPASSLVPAHLANPLDAYNHVNKTRDQSYIRQ